MSSTSQKHRDFVSEPMENKSVTKLPGIGRIHGRRLKDEGYKKAKHLFGVYLEFDEDKKTFTSWFRETTGGNRKHAKDCFLCLDEWADNFFF